VSVVVSPMEFLVLSGEAFTRDLSGSFCSVRDTLVHIIGGEWIWLAYWKTPPHSAAELKTLTMRRRVVLFNPHAFRNVAEVRLKWSEIMRSRLIETILAQHHLLFLFNGHSSKRGLSDGENQPDETLLISFGPPWWQVRCCRGREKHMMRETEVQIGNPGSNRPSIFDNDGSSHEGVLL
jgi:hypothetical protein